MKVLFALCALTFTGSVFSSPAHADKWKPEDAAGQIQIGAESFDIQGMKLPDASSPKDPNVLQIFRRNLPENAHGELGHTVRLFRDDFTTAGDVRDAFDFALQHGFTLSIPSNAVKPVDPKTNLGQWETEMSEKSKVDGKSGYSSARLVNVSNIIAHKPGSAPLTFQELVRSVRPIAETRHQLNQFSFALSTVSSNLNVGQLRMDGLYGTPQVELAQQVTGLRKDRDVLELRIREMQEEIAKSTHSLTNQTTSTNQAAVANAAR
jgi:hypothetical protein